MAGILKKFFKGKHSAKDSIHTEREFERKSSKRGSRKVAHFDQNYQVSSTAPYHTETQPRSYRATRSFAGGEISDDDERYEFLNKSLELKRPREENISRRRRFSKSWRRRGNFTEYVSGNPSLNSFMYDPTLDDSESESWAMEREKRNYELEKKLQEERERLKEYRERFKMERDLRASREKEVKEYRERCKMERELRTNREKEILALKEALKKMKREQEKLMNVTSSLQAKFDFWEQHQRYGGLYPPLLEGVVGAGESLCTISASSVPVSSPFNHSLLHSNPDEIDETKNFRRISGCDAELPRSSCSSSSVSTQDDHEITLLHNDDFDDSMLVSFIPCGRRVHSDSDLYRFSHPFDPLLQL